LGPSHRPLALLAGAAAIATAWLLVFPREPRADPIDILAEASYVLAVAVAYPHIARLKVPLLEAGWVVFGASLFIEVCDELTLEPPFFGDGLPATLGGVGLVGVAVGFRRAARRLETEEERRRSAEAATATALRDSEEANARLRDALRQKDEVVSIVAHDFRSPLTVIQGFSETLRDRTDDPAQRESLDAIHEQARYLSALARDTLVMSRLESGELALARTRLDLAAAVRQAVQVRVAAPAVVRADGPVCVDADGQRIRQVVDNLLDNALKYATPGRDIVLSVSAEEPWALLTVADSGPGIAAADIPRLFEKFGRLESARESGIPGSGLGLFICRSIIEAHGGAIAVRSAAGQGSTFTVRLPLAPAGSAC
jgi:signal transduction histidine kinase